MAALSNAAPVVFGASSGLDKACSLAFCGRVAKLAYVSAQSELCVDQQSVRSSKASQGLFPDAFLDCILPCAELSQEVVEWGCRQGSRRGCPGVVKELVNVVLEALVFDGLSLPQGSPLDGLRCFKAPSTPSETLAMESLEGAQHAHTLTPGPSCHGPHPWRAERARGTRAPPGGCDIRS